MHNNKSFIYSFLHGWLGTGLLTSNGDKWHRRRKLLTPAFHFNILQPFVDIFNKETDNLVEDLLQSCNEEYIDVVKPITEFTLFSIGETSLGVNLKEKDSISYKQAIHKYGQLIPDRVVNPLLYSDFIYSKTKYHKQMKNVINILHDFSTNIIKERKEQKNTIEKSGISYSERKRLALLDLLLDKGLEDEEIREEIDTFIFEGHDTTSMALCYALVTLANEQKYQVGESYYLLIKTK
ncbi:unnamed protein product [Psylliodes chrysocephalus]|uniref:Cytochrome P450 n=1 Tax=Psylliodes chrysocephalus TaxID=3402493 RepID=A0A9P0CIU2_9CUCU|nr:unnamed protein product [Psylliodes chrysocephala]